METLELIFRLLVVIVAAMLAGKLVSKLKLPSILGFLITGMVLGPYAFNVMSVELSNASWYHTLSRILEIAIGVLFAKDLVINKLKKYGKQVFTITMFESLGTFVVVTLVFGAVCLVMDIPLYVSVIFGGIALATAPAPAISIVNEYKTKGELTKILIPMALMDDVIAMAVFFTINAIIASMGATAAVSPLAIIGLSIGVPVMLGIVLGFILKPVYKRNFTKKQFLILTIITILGTYLIAYGIDNYILPFPTMNYMMLGMALFTTITNIIPEENMEKVASSVTPIVGIGIIIMILNLSAPLDYKLIFGAGLLTFIYIISRALGKYFSTYIGAKTSKSSDNIKKYLGLVLLPHSGVSLVFTGMAVTSLNTFDTASAVIVQGTIAAAAVINEIFAVVFAKKGFELAGELDTTSKKLIKNVALAGEIEIKHEDKSSIENNADTLELQNNEENLIAANIELEDELDIENQDENLTENPNELAIN